MATRTSVSSGAWSASSTWDTGVPVDGDTVVIAAGHSVEFDVDQSGWTGLAGLTIHGGATPGMLYAKYSSAGTRYLTIRDGYQLNGTTSTNRGRLVATHDGTFASTTPLSYDRKFTIDLKTTGKILATDLDINMLSDDPATTELCIYAEDYGPASQSTNVNTTTGVIDFGETLTGLSNGDAVRVRSTGTLPGGLYEEDIYFAYNVSGQTCNLRGYSGMSINIVPDDVGTGNITLYRGWSTSDSTSWGAGKNTPKVLEDVTSDNWAVGDYVVVCNAFGYDAQLCTLSAINSGTVQLSSAVSTNKYPLSKIVLLTRNVQVITSCSTSAQNIIEYVPGSTQNGNFGAIYNTTNMSGCGIRTLKSGNISVVGYLRYGFNAIIGLNIDVIAGCNMGIYWPGTNGGNIINKIFGCYNGLAYSDNTGGKNYVTYIEGCFSAILYNNNNIIGTITGCEYGFSYSKGNNCNTITSCTFSMIGGYGNGYGHSIDNIRCCMYGLYAANSYAHSIKHCYYGLCGKINEAREIAFCEYGAYRCVAILYGTIFHSNVYDLYEMCNFIGYGVSLRSSIQHYVNSSRKSYHKHSIVYDPVNSSDIVQEGRILVWTNGGYGESAEGGDVPSSPPVSLDWCHKWTFESSEYPIWVDVPVLFRADITTSIPVYIKCSQTPSGMYEHPHIQLIDNNSTWGDTTPTLRDTDITDTTDWQTVTISYTPSIDTLFMIRMQATNDSGTLYWYADIPKYRQI